MAILTQKEFAELVGIKPGNVNTYYGRGKLVYEPDKRIDTEHEVNRAFIELMKSGGGKAGRPRKTVEPVKVQEPPKVQQEQKPAAEPKTQPKQVPQYKKPVSTEQIKRTEEDTDEKTSVFKLQIQRQQLELERLKVLTQKDTINVDKLLGQVIPVRIVTDFFKAYNQGATTQTRSHMEGILLDIAHESGLKADAIAIYKRQIVEGINLIQDKLVQHFFNEIEAGVFDFSETRGKGERK